MQSHICRVIIRRPFSKTQVISSNTNLPRRRKPDTTSRRLSSPHSWKLFRKIHPWIYSCARGSVVDTSKSSSRCGLKYRHLQLEREDQKFHLDIRLSLKRNRKIRERLLQMSAFPRLSKSKKQEMSQKLLLLSIKEHRTFIGMFSFHSSHQQVKISTLSKWWHNQTNGRWSTLPQNRLGSIRPCSLVPSPKPKTSMSSLGWILSIKCFWLRWRNSAKGAFKPRKSKQWLCGSRAGVWCSREARAR